MTLLRRIRTAREDGFTLLELLVVLAILGLLIALVAPQVLGFRGRANVQAAQVQVRNIESAIQNYQLDVGRPPSQTEGLQALVTQPAGVASWSGPYLTRLPDDPWGHPYQYRIPGENGRAFDVVSLGSDSQPGGSGEAKDITN
jgi:general secretion pathway protein G